MNNFTPQALAQLDKPRMSAYKQNLDFYNGSHWLKTSRERQLVFNYAKVAIDKVTSYLMAGLDFACYPKEIETETEKGKGAGSLSLALAVDRRAEQVIYEVYEQNNLQQLDWETEVDTAILGDGCYKVTWDATEKRIRVTAPDVTGLFAWWLGDDLSRVWRVASRYTLTADEVTMLYPSSAGRVKTTKKTVQLTEVWTAQQFELYLDNDPLEKKPNPYGFIPFVIFPNLRQPKQFWGTSDIPPLTESQRELNRALSQLSRILEVSGNPIAVLENVSESADIKVQPGAVWTLPEDAKAYLLDLLQGGGIRLHIDYIDLVYRCLHDLSEAPRAAYGGIERELSGVALEVELHSLLQKVKRKRTTRTNAYMKRNQMLLALWAKFTREDLTAVSHRIIWAPILPQDRARLAQNEQLLVQAGVHSRRRAMDELGVDDPDREFDRWMEERRRILEMNLEYRARTGRGGPRERAVAAETEGVPELPE